MRYLRKALDIMRFIIMKSILRSHIKVTKISTKLFERTH